MRATNQSHPDTKGSDLIHHLHRQESDHGNAAYGYSRAKKPTPPRDLTINQEWHDQVNALEQHPQQGFPSNPASSK